MKKLAIWLLTLLTAVMLSIGAASCEIGGGGSSDSADYIGYFSLQSVTYNGTTYESGDTYGTSTVNYTLDIMSTYLEGYDGMFKLTDESSLTSYYYYIGGWKLSGSTITLQVKTAMSTQSSSSVNIALKGTYKDGTLTLTSSASNFPSKFVFTKR